MGRRQGEGADRRLRPLRRPQPQLTSPTSPRKCDRDSFDDKPDPLAAEDTLAAERAIKARFNGAIAVFDDVGGV